MFLPVASGHHPVIFGFVTNSSISGRQDFVLHMIVVWPPLFGCDTALVWPRKKFGWCLLRHCFLLGTMMGISWLSFGQVVAAGKEKLKAVQLKDVEMKGGKRVYIYKIIQYIMLYI